MLLCMLVYCICINVATDEHNVAGVYVIVETAGVTRVGADLTRCVRCRVKFSGIQWFKDQGACGL